jgi:vancomycin resistance protein VanJ
MPECHTAILALEDAVIVGPAVKDRVASLAYEFATALGRIGKVKLADDSAHKLFFVVIVEGTGICIDANAQHVNIKPTRRWPYRLTAAIGAVYIAALILVLIALRLIGEQWWLTSILMYVPRLVFLLPAAPLLLLALWMRSRMLIFMQSVAIIAGSILAGFNFSLPRQAGTAFHFELATCNMATGTFAVEGIVQALRQSNADIILLQEAHESLHARLTSAAGGGQFFIASRFPITAVVEPEKLLFNGQMRSPRFIRYQLSTPRGPLLVYNVHFISPRDGLEELRGEGFAHELRHGNLLPAKARSIIDTNSALRELQMQAVREDAARAPYAAIIAGDTNLPSWSWALAHWFGNYRDGFSDAGRGFGYTFPAPSHPWMRIDRVLADRVFEFNRFTVVRRPLSDHFPVIAQLSWPPGA